MPDEQFGEKTEDPTPRRREEAREQGNVPKSQDLTAGIVLLGAVLLLALFGERLLATMKILVQTLITGATSENITRTEDLGQSFAMAMNLAMQMIAPIALGVLILSLAAGVMQVGFMVTGQPLTPKFSKISPVNGLKQILGMRGLVRLIMSLLKVAIVLAVAWVTIHMDLPKVMSLVRLEAGPLLAAASSLVWWLALKIALVLLILGLIDFFYQKWQHEQDLKMSKHEVKEEHKRMEGDPLVKQRRQKVARQLTEQRLNHDVPQADVVVSNPTHYALALRYDSEQMNAPKVVAKGADYLAMRIRQIASVHGIPIVEKPPLARAMYRAVEVNDEIPPQFYAAVAEILAYVYRLNDQRQPA